MIFDMFSNFVLSILALILLVFPAANGVITADITDGVAPFRTAFASANYILPVGQFFGFLGIVISIELLLFGYKIFMWLAKNLSLGFLKG